MAAVTSPTRRLPALDASIQALYTRLGDGSQRLAPDGVPQLPVALERGRLPVALEAALEPMVSKDLTAGLGGIPLGGDPLNQLPGEFIVPVPANAGTVLMRLATGWSGTVAFDVLFQEGGAWDTMVMYRADTTAGGAAINTTTAGSYYDAPVPPGALYVRARVSNYTTGPITVRIGFQNYAYEPGINVLSMPNVQLLNTSRMGMSGAGAIWTNESTAVLAPAGSVSGASQDMTGKATGVQTTNTGYPEEFRGSASADVAGTLYLEVSHNGTTWRRVRAIPMVQDDPTCDFYAEVVWRPSQRYARVAFVNGPAAQSHFNLQSYQVAA